MEIAEFLLERIAEDEGVAGGAWRDSLADGGEPRRWEPAGPAVMLRDSYITVMMQTEEVDPVGALAAHAARHDPARVLAECEAKRTLVEHHPSLHPEASHLPAVVGLYDLVLRTMAAVYADHPDYDPAWRLTA